MAIFLTGDTHGDFSRFRPDIFYEQAGLTKDDCTIICGDFGGVWDGSPEEQGQLDWLEQRPYTTLFVSGNHENYDLLAQYPVEEWHGGQVQRIRPSVIHLMRGRHTTLRAGSSSLWAVPAATTSRMESWSRTTLCSRKMQAAGCQGRAVPGEPPVLVGGGVAQRGGIPDRQGQPGQSGLGSRLHHHPLLLHQCARRIQRWLLPERRPDRVL